MIERRLEIDAVELGIEDLLNGLDQQFMAMPLKDMNLDTVKHLRGQRDGIAKVVGLLQGILADNDQPLLREPPSRPNQITLRPPEDNQ